MKRKIFLIILVLSWMGLIFYFSSQNAQDSTSQSRGVLEKTNIIKKYEENKSEAEKELIISTTDLYFRKLAHIAEFLVLSVLVCFLIKEYTLDIKKILLISFIICLIYSCSDELHQLFVLGRSAELMDVFIDNIGCFIGYIIFYISGIKIWKKSN